MKHREPDCIAFVATLGVSRTWNSLLSVFAAVRMGGGYRVLALVGGEHVDRVMHVQPHARVLRGRALYLTPEEVIFLML